MTNSFSKNRPTFDQFRQWFMETLAEHSQVDPRDGMLPWHEFGNEQMRQDILTAFGLRLEKELGASAYIENRLVTLDKPIESVVIQLFHSFSTVSLVDHILLKTYGRK